MSDTLSPSLLPLTPFEEYMLADDRARQPMTFWLKAEVQGRLDRDVWRQAVDDMLPRHPLLCRLLEGDETAGYHWTAKIGPPPAISWGGPDEPLDFPAGRMIDLRRQRGLRIWVRGDEHRATLWFEFHHACCDGVGAAGFIDDCLNAYAMLVEAAGGSRLRTVDPARLARRGRFGLTWWRRLLRLPQELLALVGVVEFYSHRPLSLVDDSDEEDQAADLSAGPLSLSHQFDAEKLQELRSAARARGATVNDLLVTCLFAALHDWVAEHKPDAAGKIARVMVPMNLRLPADDATPAANIVCMINLDRRMNAKATVPKLLRLVSLEMGIVKRCRLGLAFHHILGLAQRLRRIPRLLPTDRCLATCVLSNLGEPLVDATIEVDARRGPLRLQSLALLPPLRPHTAAAFGVVTHGTVTTLSMHRDPSLSLQKAEDLLRLFSRQIEGCLAGDLL
ncbi:MAG TPA: hypothetical protein VHD36_20960 [Pirellulales bacterium]|nr:hypothetical protein [Pirellulales bacterium]